MIRAVVFDFGGVLAFHPTMEHFGKAAAYSGVESKKLFAALWKNRIPYDAGQVPYDYWRGVASHAGANFDDPTIARMIQFEIEFWSKYDDRVFTWIKQLRASGIRTGILSNLPRPLGENLRETEGFLEHFDHVTFSYELGLVKPQRGIYDDAIRGAGVNPEEALFLDDRPENIQGAIEAGMRAELFTTWEDFVKEMPERYHLPTPQ